MQKTANDIIKFWFVDHGMQDWYGGGEAFDNELKTFIGDDFARIAAGEAYTWRTTPVGRAAEIIVLDQFSRQLFRNDPRAFAHDTMALALAQEAVAGGHDKALDQSQRMFAYMPYMHSESLVIHEEAQRLFGSLGSDDAYNFELKHVEILNRFGRYPKRNKALGRSSTEEEIAYIKASGDSMF